ncbi:hypothetical protein P12x_005792 [Tundrisphaera lichenicola]|uniref:hypothetical protein n=1 Tax=Tundrisphaera lichenicola TaxID=2029860 RepID=UPI003EB849B6
MQDRRSHGPLPPVAPLWASSMRPGIVLDRIWAALAIHRGMGPLARPAPTPEATFRPRWAGRDAIRARPARRIESPDLPAI